eukprot:Clim_evm18s213 gene=Clim_evmTU18s213
MTWYHGSGKSVLHQLLEREIKPARPSANLNRDRLFYSHLYPNHTVFNCVAPQNISLKKFSPCGKYMIGYGKDDDSVVMYRFEWNSYIIPVDPNATEQPGCWSGSREKGKVPLKRESSSSVKTEPSDQQQTSTASMSHLPGMTRGGQNLTHSDHKGMSEHEALNPMTCFSRFFKFHWHRTLTQDDTQKLERSTFLFSMNSKYVVLATTSPCRALTAGANHPDYTPETRLEVASVNYTFYCLSVQTGECTDRITFEGDQIPLGRLNGVCMFDNVLAVLSIKFQCIRIIELKEGGNFVHLQKIGWLCHQDDELTLSKFATDAEEYARACRQAFNPEVSNPGANVKKNVRPLYGRRRLSGSSGQGPSSRATQLGTTLSRMGSLPPATGNLDQNDGNRGRSAINRYGSVRSRLRSTRSAEPGNSRLAQSGRGPPYRSSGQPGMLNTPGMDPGSGRGSTSSQNDDATMDVDADGNRLASSSVGNGEEAVDLPNIGILQQLLASRLSNRMGPQNPPPVGPRPRPPGPARAPVPGPAPVYRPPAEESEGPRRQASGGPTSQTNGGSTGQQSGSQGWSSYPGRAREGPTGNGQTEEASQQSLNAGVPRPAAGTAQGQNPSTLLPPSRNIGQPQQGPQSQPSQPQDQVQQPPAPNANSGSGGTEVNSTNFPGLSNVRIVRRRAQSRALFIIGGDGRRNQGSAGQSTSGTDGLTGGTGIGPVGQSSLLGGLKHRILTHLYRLAKNDPRDPVHAVRRFRALFKEFENMVMVQQQLIGRDHLLIRFVNVKAIGIPQRSSSNDTQVIMFVVYNMTEAKVVGCYDNTSEEFLAKMEASCDILRSTTFTKPVNFVSTCSSNLYARDAIYRNRSTVRTARHGGREAAVRRFLNVLPFMSQCWSDSPYFDQNIFYYDEKGCNAAERPKPVSDFPVKFYCRGSGRLKFKVHTQFSAVDNGNGNGSCRKKGAVCFLFHPIYPFLLTLNFGHEGWLINIQCRHEPATGVPGSANLATAENSTGVDGDNAAAARAAQTAPANGRSPTEERSSGEEGGRENEVSSPTGSGMNLPYD